MESGSAHESCMTLSEDRSHFLVADKALLGARERVMRIDHRTEVCKNSQMRDMCMCQTWRSKAQSNFQVNIDQVFGNYSR